MYQNIRQNILLFFSLRFIKPYKKIFPNISVIISSLAVTISLAILIIVMSVMNGFSIELINKILGLNSHITIYSNNEKFENIKDTQQIINKIDGVEISFPVISGSGMVMNNHTSSGVVVKGISRKDIKNNIELKKTLVVDLDNFKGFTVILGKDIARQLNVKKNDEITMIIPIVENTMFGTIPRQVKLKVVGVINSHSQQYDSYMAIIPFKAAQRIFNLKNNASAIEIITNDPEHLDKIETKILNLQKYYLVDWQMENNALLHALKVESNVMSLILGLFVVISTFTIYAVIRMMIKSKEREIAILKAHGISNKQISKIFFITGLFICIVGMIFGNTLGIVFALNIDDIRQCLESIFHTKLLDGDVYLLSNLPSKIIYSDIIKINIFVFITSVCCIFLSIKKNTKIDIVKVLRNN